MDFPGGRAMTVDGKKIGATAMLADQNALRRRKEQLEETARKKEEGQKQAVHILTTAMEKGTSMEEARTAANDLLAALSEEIVSDCMSRARDHISDILEQNQKKADEIAEKKRKKELHFFGSRGIISNAICDSLILKAERGEHK